MGVVVLLCEQDTCLCAVSQVLHASVTTEDLLSLYVHSHSTLLYCIFSNEDVFVSTSFPDDFYSNVLLCYSNLYTLSFTTKFSGSR